MKTHILLAFGYLLVGATGVLAHRFGWNLPHPIIGIGATLLLGAMEWKLLSTTRAKGFLLLMGLAFTLLFGLGARMGLTSLELHSIVVGPVVIAGFIWHVRTATLTSSPGNPV